MYAKRKSALKRLITVLSMILVMLMGVAGTLAYLQVQTNDVVNTFAPSNIDLTLAETATEGGSTAANTYKMIPGVDIAKDPKVTVTADIDCYVFVKVVETENFDTYMTYAIASGWKLYDSGDTTIDTVANDTYVLYREVSAYEAKDSKAFYVLADNKVTVPNTVTKTQMDALYDSSNAVITADQPKLTFTAYAIQKAGFENDLAGAWAAAQGQQTQG